MIIPKKLLSIPIEQTFYVATSGDDALYEGSLTRPFATIPAALAAIALLPPGNYNVQLLPGTYNGAPIAWPGNVNLVGSGTGITSVGHDINYTTPAAVDSISVFKDLNLTGVVTIDLTLGGVTFAFFLNSGLNDIRRVDSTAGAKIVGIYGGSIGSFNFVGNILLFNTLFLSGGPYVVDTGGQMLCNSCLTPVPFTINAGGTLLLNGCQTSPGSVYTGAGTVASDSSSLFGGATIAGPTLTLTDNATYEAFVPAVPADWSPVPATVKEALDQLKASASGVVPTTFVYRPGGVAAANVYISWAALYAVLNVTAGPKLVQIDNSIVTPVVIPAGTYDLSDTTIVGLSKNFQTALQLADGVVFQNLDGFANGVVAESLSSTPIIVYNDGLIHFLRMNSIAAIRSTGAATFIQATGAGTTLFILATTACELGVKSLEADASANNTFISFWNGCTVANDAFEGNGNIDVGMDASSSVSTTQTLFTGVLSTDLKDQSNAVRYSPANGLDWSVLPDQVAEALDELAANTLLRPDGLYVVAGGNGSDVTGNGSWQRPFATIQAAITQAVADGHNFSDQAEIVVLPSTGYAGFTTSPGINVTGIHGDKIGVRVDHIDHVPDASGFASNYVEISNLTVDVGGNDAVTFGPGNSGTLVLRNCKIRCSSAGFSSVLLNNTGSVVNIDDCEIVSAGTGITVTDGFLESINASTDVGFEPALSVGAAGTFVGSDTLFISNGGGVPVMSTSGLLTLEECRIVNASGAGGSPVLDILAGTTNLYNCLLSAAGANNNFQVALGATIQYGNLMFIGASSAFTNAGTQTDFSELYIPTTSADWAGDPVSIKEAVDRLATAVAGLLGGPIP